MDRPVMPEKGFADWLVKLYEDFTEEELCAEYVNIVHTDLTDDVDCSPSNIIDRAERMTYLAHLLGEDVANQLDRFALHRAHATGYASGVSWDGIEEAKADGEWFGDTAEAWRQQYPEAFEEGADD